MNLFDKSTPGFILWTIAQLAPNVCPNIYRMLREKDPTLDQFALKFLGSSWDSTKGEAYALPKEVAAYTRVVYANALFDQFQLCTLSATSRPAQHPALTSC